MTQRVIMVCRRDCYDTCALIATMDACGRIVSMRGDPAHPMTCGFLPSRCQGTRAAVCQTRAAPVVRGADGSERSDWEAAQDWVAEKLTETLQQHGSESVLCLTYAGNAGLLTVDIAGL